MWRAILATILAFAFISCPIFGQQFNPFTAVLKSPVSRPTVKEGRKRFTIQTTNFSTNSRSNSTTLTAKNNSATNKTNTHSRRTNKHNTSTHDNKVALAKQPSTLAKDTHHKQVIKHTDESVSTQPATEQPGTFAAEPLDLRRNIGIHYQVMTVDQSGELRVDDAKRVFHSGEKFRLKIEANINANLYLLLEDNQTGERRLLFPNYKFQSGSARVKPLTPVVVPPLNQPAFQFDNQPGEERLIVICSRDQIPALEIATTNNLPTGALKLLSNSAIPTDLEQSIKLNDQPVSRDFIWVNESTAKQPQHKTGTYVVNTSHKDNEEIVYLIRLKHGD